MPSLTVRIVLTGASGAIGAELAPRLADAGHEVRAYARDPARVTAAGVSEVVRGDILTGAGLDQALEGADVGYYLIHSMETTAPSAGTFSERERASAERFAAAAARAGLRRVVYLGGLVPQTGGRPSPHLASRLAVEELLLAGAPEAVALRASIVIGVTSRSFRFLVRLVERVPVMPLPAWREHRTQPIDVRDVLAYLVAAGTGDVGGTLSLDVAGPEVVTYGRLMDRIREALLVDRAKLRLPFSLTPVASVVAAAIAGEDPALIAPLMEGLEADLLPRDDRAREVFPGVRVHPLDAAIERALRRWEESEALRAR